MRVFVRRVTHRRVEPSPTAPGAAVRKEICSRESDDNPTCRVFGLGAPECVLGYHLPVALLGPGVAPVEGTRAGQLSRDSVAKIGYHYWAVIRRGMKRGRE